jgi:hypothetical protein
MRVTIPTEENMAIETLSYRQLGERLGCTRDVARAWVKQLRLPCHIANNGKALVSVDLSEINHAVVPTRSPAFQDSATAMLEPIEAKLEPATGRADFERERAERLMAELLRAKADLLAARATTARLESELAVLRSRPFWHWLIPPVSGLWGVSK